MLKFVCFLAFILTTVKGQNGLYPITNTFKVTHFEIQPNNNFILLLQNGLSVWKKTIAKGTTELKVYVQSMSVEQLLPAGDLCSPTFFFNYVRQLTVILTNGRSCPIQAGTSISLLRSYAEHTSHPPKSCLGIEILNFTLYDETQRSKVMSVEMEVKSSGQACIRS